MKCNCTVLMTKHQSLNVCEHFPVFLLVFLRVAIRGRHEESIRFNKNSSHTFVPDCSVYVLAKFHGDLSILHTLGGASFCLQKIYKHVTPSLTIMSTQGSHCEPRANDIIEPLTFTASKMALRGKAIVFQSRFP